MDKITITIDAVTLETIRMGLGALQLQAQAARAVIDGQVALALEQQKVIDAANAQLANEKAAFEAQGAPAIHDTEAAHSLT